MLKLLNALVTRLNTSVIDFQKENLGISIVIKKLKQSILTVAEQIFDLEGLLGSSNVDYYFIYDKLSELLYDKTMMERSLQTPNSPTFQEKFLKIHPNFKDSFLAIQELQEKKKAEAREKRKKSELERKEAEEELKLIENEIKKLKNCVSPRT